MRITKLIKVLLIKQSIQKKGKKFRKRMNEDELHV